MKRKAIQLASQTIVVSLPAKWVKQQGIKKGDEIDVEERGNELIINCKGDKAEKKIEINISEINKSLIWRYILSAYRSGCDEIKVISKNHIDSELINKIVDNLIGFEIIEQKSECCLIKDISSVKDEEFENILKRIFFILISISEDLLELAKRNEFQKASTIVSADRQVNKFTDYCLRLLSKKQDSEPMEKIVLYHLISHLESIGDNLKAIAKLLLILKQKKLSKEILELYEEFNEILAVFSEFFYKFDINKAQEIYKKREKVQRIYDSISDKLNINEKEISVCIRLNINLVIDIIDDVFSRHISLC